MKSPLSPELLSAAREVFAYLSAVDPLPEDTVDAVIGFGMFDVSLASFCGELYNQRRVRRIVFTGGMGAGTADLGRPEAEAWRDELARTHPTIPSEHLVIENRSTNTAENIAYTVELLARSDPPLVIGGSLSEAFIVASPSRLRRVMLTLQQMHPALQIFRCLPPSINFDEQFSRYESKGINYITHLAGELDRIADYPKRGWIAAEPFPERLIEARAILKGR
jgi:uncharacterized SAM-binding protein YcdF (DUF218 family)